MVFSDFEEDIDPYEVRFERVRDLLIAIMDYNEQLMFSDPATNNDMQESLSYAWQELRRELEIDQEVDY